MERINDTVLLSIKILLLSNQYWFIQKKKKNRINRKRESTI